MTIPKRLEEVIEEQNQEKLATTVAWPETAQFQHPGLLRPTFQLSKEFLKNVAENEAKSGPGVIFPEIDAADIIGAGVNTIRKNPGATSDLIKGLHQKVKEAPVKKQTPFVMPQSNSSGHGEGQNINVQVPQAEPSGTIPPETPETQKAAPANTPPAAPEPDKTKGRKLPTWNGNLHLQVPHTVVQTNSPLHPMFSSKNDSNRLLNLIGELYFSNEE
jgi:hypothetical protein